MAASSSNEELADLCALADGSLPAERRADVEARIAASPALQELFERQRRAVLATRTLAAEEPPASLRAAVDAQRRARASRPWFAPRVALAGAAAAAAAIVAAVLLTNGPGAPTVADAARLATQAPTAPAPPPAGPTGTKLALAVDGVPFPDLTRFAGWRAVGARAERISGRPATAVFYRKDGRRLGYVIVSGSALARPTQANVTYIRRVEYRTLRFDGRPAVTWLRHGRTCVLLGQATRAELLRLASWPLTPLR